ncbi:hypothetical protein ACP4OV_023208 [Aristida adscensionis]
MPHIPNRRPLPHAPAAGHRPQVVCRAASLRWPPSRASPATLPLATPAAIVRAGLHRASRLQPLPGRRANVPWQVSALTTPRGTRPELPGARRRQWPPPRWCSPSSSNFQAVQDRLDDVRPWLLRAKRGERVAVNSVLAVAARRLLLRGETGAALADFLRLARRGERAPAAVILLGEHEDSLSSGRRAARFARELRWYAGRGAGRHGGRRVQERRHRRP